MKNSSYEVKKIPSILSCVPNHCNLPASIIINSITVPIIGRDLSRREQRYVTNVKIPLLKSSDRDVGEIATSSMVPW